MEQQFIGENGGIVRSVGTENGKDFLICEETRTLYYGWLEGRFTGRHYDREVIEARIAKMANDPEVSYDNLEEDNG